MGESDGLEKRVLIADRLESDAERVLNENGIHVDYRPDITTDELIRDIPNYNGLIVRSKTKVPREIIDAAANLQIIGRPGAGVDTIDIEAANKKGIAVVNTPYSNKYAVAELVFGYMLALSRSIVQYDGSTKKGEWNKGKMPGKTELFGKTIGIIGIGNIGSEVAKRADGFGMNILYYDPAVRTYERGKKAKSLDQIFEKSDFVTVHVPSTPSTKEMIKKENLEKIKKNGTFINTSRGEVVSKGSLEEALEKRADMKAAVDVFYKGEEKEGEKSLARFGGRVILTPHIGASTNDAQIRGAVGVAEQIIEFFKSGRAAYALNLERIEERFIPYRSVAEKISYLGCSLLGMKPEKIEITCYGNLKNFNKAFLNVALMNSLKYQSDLENVNEINASYLAKEVGIETKIREGDESKGYGDTITLDFSANGESTSIRGTIYDGKVKFMRIGNYDDLSVVAEGKQLMAMYDESYGILGAIGDVLGKYKISVVSMGSGEDKAASRELAFLKTKTDTLLGDTELNEIRKAILSRQGTIIDKEINVYQIKHLDFDRMFQK